MRIIFLTALIFLLYTILKKKENVSDVIYKTFLFKIIRIYFAVLLSKITAIQVSTVHPMFNPTINI